MPSFNLIDEPWLPCLDRRGRPVEVSLSELFPRAHELRELYDPSPLVTVALHRLLLAILHRALDGPVDLDTWTPYWRQGRWQDDRIPAYLSEWRPRFDLFDPERPFYQIADGAGLGEIKTVTGLGEIKPVTVLIEEAASGNNPTLFDHRVDADPVARSPAAAARYLVARQAFTIGFGRSPTGYSVDSPFLRGYSVLALGANLFETLALNLIPSGFWLVERNDRDKPWWERDDPPPPVRADRAAAGYLDYLTWQSRCVRLIPEGEPPLVRWCQEAQYLKLTPEPQDPFKSYLVDNEQGVRPRGLSPDRALWRDSHVLFEHGNPTSKPPVLFDWLARIAAASQEGAIAAQTEYQYALYGFGTDTGKAASILLWRQERLPLVTAYLNDDRLVATLRDALHVAELVGRMLRPGTGPNPATGKGLAPRPLQVLAEGLLPAPGDSRPDPNTVSGLADHLGIERRYWSSLELPFRRLLHELPADLTDDDGIVYYGDTRVLPAWEHTLRRAATRAFDAATFGIEGTGRDMLAVAAGRRTLSWWLRHLLSRARVMDQPDQEEVADERVPTPA